MFDKIHKILSGGAEHNAENDELLNTMTKEQLIEQLKIKDTEIKKLKMTAAERTEKRNSSKKTLDAYTNLNINKWVDIYKASDAHHKNPEVIQYDEDFSTFDIVKSGKDANFKFRPYQQKFIEDWSISTNELVVLYYGVGSGKTLIAINCAEQFINLNPEAYIYFLMPASLVINTIMKMYEVNLDPRRKNKQGKYVYKFISYQQIMLSKFDIEPNSLLIIDEAHNLRNFATKEIKNKISARKWENTGEYSLIGNKVATMLLKNKNTFLRTIMMTGTLFCNSKYDLEPLIAIGYKRSPKIDKDINDLIQIEKSNKEFKRYYGGLISFFRLSDDDKDFPKKKYHFIPINAEMTMGNAKEDRYYIKGRNDGMSEKVDWIEKFILSRKNDKTLIYAEFMDRAITQLMKKLRDNNFNVVEITGSENIAEKQAGIKLYNTDKIKLLVFSKAIKEGISFKETNNFIFIQPYWNYAISEQIIARAVRLDSHKKKQQSTVNIYCLIGVNYKDLKKTYDSNDLKEIKSLTYGYGKKIMAGAETIIDCPDDLVEYQTKYKLQYERQQEKKQVMKKSSIDSSIKEWIKSANKIMNDNIKNLIYPSIEEIVHVKKMNKDTGKISTNYYTKDIVIRKRFSPYSRDTYIWDMMFNKQEEINVFEKKLLKPELSFEKYISNENNEFIQEYNLELEKLISSGKKISYKDEITLKRKMYKDAYSKKIEQTNATLKRFLEDATYKANRNPDLQKQIGELSTVNMESMRNLFNKKASLSEIFDYFKIDKQQITNYQANFTAKQGINLIIEMSGIEKDIRDNIKVLEPTSGIGGIITELIKINNRDKLMIDSNEIHKVFYTFQTLLFENIDNIFIYNTDFTIYEARYRYN